MEDTLTYTLLTMMTTDHMETMLQRALQALVMLMAPRAAVLLIWDYELQRYIIGETWLPQSDRKRAAALRRHALHLAGQAYAKDYQMARCVEAGVFYQPLNATMIAGSAHVGAIVAEGVHSAPTADNAPYQLFLRAITKALAAGTRLQQANREHDELEAERARLEELLHAVEQQQRTIDRLLTVERQFSASLEAKVAERTVALEAAQQRLIQSEKLAVIGQLASSLAHELNNPLQAMQSGLGLVMDEINAGSTDYIRDDLHMIQQELERIQGIFHQMLDFYRPVRYAFTRLDINAICEGVRVLMRKRLQEAKITLELDLAPELPLTCGDGNQIKQILLNLMLNAAEAINGVGGVITLITVADADMVRVSVSDDGPGITAAHRRRLFEPLFTTKTRGLGLGLAISQEIAQRHDGHLQVASELGQGTTFTLSLPVREQCDDER